VEIPGCRGYGSNNYLLNQAAPDRILKIEDICHLAHELMKGEKMTKNNNNCKTCGAAFETEEELKQHERENIPSLNVKCAVKCSSRRRRWTHT
jgi:hypothetical protein